MCKAGFKFSKKKKKSIQCTMDVQVWGFNIKNEKKKKKKNEPSHQNLRCLQIQLFLSLVLKELTLC